MVSGWKDIICTPGNLLRAKGQGWRPGWGIPVLGDMGALRQTWLVVKGGEVVIWWNHSRAARQHRSSFCSLKGDFSISLGSNMLLSVKVKCFGVCGSHSLVLQEAAVRSMGCLYGGGVLCVFMCLARISRLWWMNSKENMQTNCTFVVCGLNGRLHHLHVVSLQNCLVTVNFDIFVDNTRN